MWMMDRPQRLNIRFMKPVRTAITNYSISTKIPAVFLCKNQQKILVRISEYSISIKLMSVFMRSFHGIFIFSTENQAFQFFVRATDRGSPALYADVSVEVYIMSSKDVPPVFEKNNDKILLPEEAVAGIVSIHQSFCSTLKSFV